MNREPFTPRRFGKYLLLERIGRGGMAEVFRAKTFGAAGFEKEVAVKRILTDLIEDEEFTAMFIDEAKLMVSLNHANIVQVYELGEVERQYFIAMEFVHGKDLLDLLANCSRNRIRLPHDFAIYISMEMLKGLHFAHNATNNYGEPLQIIHRDVSPSNIMLTYSGQVKVGDFGIAKSDMQSQSTQVGVQKGKLGYMSPEQVTGKPIDHRSDVFAAGVILFETLSMTRLFKAKNELDVMLKIRDVRIEDDLDRARRLPFELRAIIERALAKNPDDRWRSCEELHDALQDYAFENGIKASGPDLSAFVREIFADDIADEKAARKNDPSSPQGFDESLTFGEITYRYRDEDGRIHGPMELELIEELLESRSLAPTERVSVSGGPWVQIDEVDELRDVSRKLDGEPVDPRALRDTGESKDWEELALAGINPMRAPKRRKRPADDTGLPPVDDIEEPESDLHLDPLDSSVIEDPPPGDPEMTGQLGKISFTRLLGRLWERRSTGMLVVSNGSHRKDLHFGKGVPGIIDSTKQTELLGNYLVSEGVLSADQLNAALHRVDEFGGRLGDALVALRMMPPHELFNFLNQQLELKLVDMFTWFESSWAWYPRHRPPEGVISLMIPVESIITRAVHGTCGVDYLRAYFAQYTDAPLEAGRDLADVPFKLSPREVRAASLVQSGDRPNDAIRRLLRSNRWNEVEAHQSLFLLTETGVLSFRGVTLPPLPE